MKIINQWSYQSDFGINDCYTYDSIRNSSDVNEIVLPYLEKGLAVNYCRIEEEHDHSTIMSCMPIEFKEYNEEFLEAIDAKGYENLDTVFISFYGVSISFSGCSVIVSRVKKRR